MKRSTGLQKERERGKESTIKGGGPKLYKTISNPESGGYEKEEDKNFNGGARPDPREVRKMGRCL